jgi:hypothetical protein
MFVLGCSTGVRPEWLQGFKLPRLSRPRKELNGPAASEEANRSAAPGKDTENAPTSSIQITLNSKDIFKSRSTNIAELMK